MFNKKNHRTGALGINYLKKAEDNGISEKEADKLFDLVEEVKKTSTDIRRGCVKRAHAPQHK